MDLTTMSTNYRALLESGQLSDLTVTIANGATAIKEYQLHQTVLGARSPVFMAMFSNDCKETAEARLTIEDMTVEVFESLLGYIYASVKPDLENHATELFVVADKYQFESLKKECRVFMASKLTIETVVQILLLADMHSDTELKSKCLDFIGKSPAPVRATASWQQLKETKRADLLDEVIEAILKAHQATVQKPKTLSKPVPKSVDKPMQQEDCDCPCPCHEEQPKTSVNISFKKRRNNNYNNNYRYYETTWY